MKKLASTQILANKPTMKALKTMDRMLTDRKMMAMLAVTDRQPRQQKLGRE